MDKRRPEKYLSGVTLRAILVALLIIPFNNYWIFMTEVVRYAGHPTTISIFYNSVFILLLLVCLNQLLKKIIPKWVFSQGELLTIYVMINIASALAGHDMIQVLLPNMTYALRFGTPENHWKTIFGTKDWLLVHDKETLLSFYNGASTLYTREHLMAWAQPVAMWMIFIFSLVFVMLCLTILLRKQWTEHEKLSYPLVELPLSVTNDKEPFFKNKLLWMGFGLALGIDLIQGLHILYPAIPGFRIKELDLANFLTTMPWKAVGWTPVYFYPFGIGLGMLLPLDLSFSSWFFFILWKLQLVTAASMGFSDIPRFPYGNEQSFGAYMGICFFAVWASRRHIRNIIIHLFTGKSEVNDEDEPLPYRTAAIGAIIGSLVLMAFTRALGMDWWLIFVFWAVFLAISLAITRMRAELGVPAHDLSGGGPDSIIPALIGPAKLGHTNLIVLTLMFWFNRSYRAHPMPFQLEGYKMAEKASISYKRLFGAILIAVMAGTLASFWTELHVYYKLGAASKIAPPGVPMAFAGEAYWRFGGWLNSEPTPPKNIACALGVGFLLTTLMNVLRMNLSYFPFHPVGYAISSTWSMHNLWMCMFIAWVIKLFLLRYGGLRLYRTAVPFFLGLILGECVMGSLWTLIGMAFNIQTYAFWP